MKKIILLGTVILLLLSFSSCTQKNYPFELSKNETEELINVFNQLTESDGEITIKPSDIEAYQINESERAGVIKAEEESEEFIFIIDCDNHMVENVFVSSEDEKKAILENDDTPNSAIQKSGSAVSNGMESEAEFNQVLIEVATGDMLDALKKANSIETKIIDTKVTVNKSSEMPYIEKVIYYYEVTATDGEGHATVGLFHADAKNKMGKDPVIYVYYDGLK